MHLCQRTKYLNKTTAKHVKSARDIVDADSLTNHFAKVLCKGDLRPMDTISTLKGIKAAYHFSFLNGNQVLFYKTSIAERAFFFYQITTTTSTKGEICNDCPTIRTRLNQDRSNVIKKWQQAVSCY